jgi:phosphonate transport system substrate-binding protein
MEWHLVGRIGQRILLLLLCLLCTLFTLPSRAQSQPQQPITLATYPFGDAARIHRAFSPLALYLEQVLDTPVRLIVTRDYGELADRLSEGSVDLAWIGSANYISTFGMAPALHYIATYRERSQETGELQAFYRAAILTQDDSDYHALSDLNGARFAFTDPDSTSGHAYPRMMLQQQGIEPEAVFADTYYLGTHRSVIEALVAGSIHAGAVSDGTYYNAVADYPGRLRVLAWSDPIPLDAFVAAPDVSASVVEQVQAALLAIGSEDHAVNRAIRAHLGWPAAGFEQRSAAFYEPLAQALAGVRRRPQ